MRLKYDPLIRAAALKLLARGYCTPSELSRVAGVSRQLVNYWIRETRLDWRDIRRRKLLSSWRVEMGVEPLPKSKAKLRKLGEEIMERINARHGQPDELEPGENPESL